jgi:hypothetical protein
MNVNLESLSMSLCGDGHIEMVFKTGSMARTSTVMLTRAEAEVALKCFKGTAYFMPYFDDGIHLLKCHPRGMVELYLNGSTLERREVVFPGAHLYEYLNGVLTTGATFSMSATQRDRVAEEVAPRMRFEYGKGYMSETGVEASIQEWGKLYPDLLIQVENLKRIALNHSDGQENVVFLRYDMSPREGVPPSFYFEIQNAKTELIMNGGIIAHPQYKYPDESAIPSLRERWKAELRNEGVHESTIAIWTEEDYAVRSHFEVVVSYAYSTHT